jgi:hypothetical protein
MKNMKKQILLLAGLSLAASALIGCGHKDQTEENAPVPSKTTSEQPMPGAAVSNDATNPPAVVWAATNNPVPTNPAATTNQ